MYRYTNSSIYFIAFSVTEIEILDEGLCGCADEGMKENRFGQEESMKRNPNSTVGKVKRQEEHRGDKGARQSKKTSYKAFASQTY
mgnify:CR=1 FL=1